MASTYINIPKAASGGGGGSVDSVNGQTGVVVISKADIGLGNVNNTSDASKPVSTLQAAADLAVQNFSIQRANHTGSQPLSTISQSGASNGQVAAWDGSNWSPSTPSAAGITALTGDVTGTGPGSTAATVALVGGKTAAQISTSVDDTITATAVNNVSTIVKRDVNGNIAVGKISFSGSALDNNRFINLDVSTTAPAQTFGIYNQVTITSNASNFAVTGNRNLTLGTNTQNITRRYIGQLNGSEHTGTGSFTGSGGLVGCDSFGQLGSAASVGYLSGVGGSANNITTGSINNAHGGFFAMNNIGAGFVTTARAITANIGNFNAGGNITTAYGLQVAPFSNSGTIGSTYGIHIGNVTAGTQTNKAFSFYVSDSSAHNFIAGPIKIGAGGDRPTATFQLDIRGNTRIQTTLGEIISATSVGLSFFAATPVAQQVSSGAATAGAVYTTTEQTMIQEMYNALRLYGLLT